MVVFFFFCLIQFAMNTSSLKVKYRRELDSDMFLQTVTRSEDLSRPFRRELAFIFLMLLRKEVIQPQVLLQLPCYDFTPITNHTVNSCLPEGWLTGFRCNQLS